MSKVEELSIKLKELDPKGVRTFRNQLNNRIKSFEDELHFNKKLPKLGASHPLAELSFKECQELLLLTKKKLKQIKSESTFEVP